METLAETPWDVTISGTGLAQSLLALALSRSGKNILHVDRNPYYGGSEAAFSLQEAQEWAESANKEPGQTLFEDATIWSPPTSPEVNGKLSPSRSYTLSLSPNLVYSRSILIPTLVTSKVYKQLEFQAVGSWWMYDLSDGESGNLHRVPSSREDVFTDDSIAVKSKRSLMRFLRHITRPPPGDQESSEEQEDLSMPFPDFLAKFNVPTELHSALLSLSLSQYRPQETPASYAVPRIQRHLTSIGVFGPGFGGLLTRWGGGSEISQVGCRALAVGGGVYVLNTGVESFTASSESGDSEGYHVVKLSGGHDIKTKFLIGTNWDLPVKGDTHSPCHKVARSITIVSSPLEELFPQTGEGGPIPAGVVVVFPGRILNEAEDVPPAYLIVHSSETSECPTGQSVIYGSISLPGSRGQSLLESAVQKLLKSVNSLNEEAKALWSLRYTQLGRVSDDVEAGQATACEIQPNVFCFPPPSLDLAFDDGTIDLVKQAWRMIMGDEASEDEFMKFEDREVMNDEE